MPRRPPISTQSRSSAASDVYKRQLLIARLCAWLSFTVQVGSLSNQFIMSGCEDFECKTDGCGPNHWKDINGDSTTKMSNYLTVSYTHLRAHETVLDLVCRLLLEKKNKKTT
eukprot:TRINITY_DN6910_c0_g1_i1.p1 TRINITY_DN6910_c0_g1~~TRINITY_DN6910_c0_g1_i1.p1  ORF type:complete len:112 (-),score=50.01 TRINITY_DN6910_c0_g1_i1:14-349(-)